MSDHQTVRDRCVHSRRGWSVVAGLIAVALTGTGHARGPQFTDFQFADPIIVEFENDQNPTMTVAADLDGDTHLDLVVPGRNADHLVHVLRGTGMGTFPPSGRTSFELPGQPQWVALAHVDDADAHLDLIVGLRAVQSQVAVVRGLGDGNFDIEQAEFIDLPGRDVDAVGARDIDGDGDVDIVVTLNRSGQVMTLRNDGTGTFAINQVELLDEITIGFAFPATVIAEDFDLDGDVDFATPGIATARVAVALNDGSGHLGEEVLYQPQLGAPTLSYDDLDGDGDDDLLVPSGTLIIQSRVTLMRNQLDGTFGGFDEITTGQSSGFGWHTAAADFDGDDDLDLAMGSILISGISFTEQVSDGGDLAFAFPFQFSVGTFIRYLLPADVNEDGAVDLLAVDIGAHRILVYLNETPQGAGSPAASSSVDPRRAGRETRIAPPQLELAARVASLDTVARRDLQVLLASWGDEARRGADLTGDGRVDLDDVTMFLDLASLPAAAGEGEPNPACTEDAGPCEEPNGTPGCNDPECCTIVCDFDPFCCDVEWDQTCVEANVALCTPRPVCPGEGDCFVAHDTPGCDDTACCELICIIDPWCCDEDLMWDALCAAEAAALCGTPVCIVDCPDGALLEVEECNERLNDGCNTNGDEPGYTPLSCGDVICAELNTGPRDTDWYEIVTDGPTRLTWEVVSEFPAQAFIIGGDCAKYELIGEAYGDGCVPATVTLDVDAGVYTLFVGTGTPVRKYLSGLPCPPEKGEEPFPVAYTRAYVATFTCEAIGEPCPEDLDGSGAVGPPDLAALLAAWGDSVAGPPDFNGDGVVGPPDLAALLAAWGDCP